MEEWAQIEGFEGLYYISSLGRFKVSSRVVNRRFYKETLLKPFIDVTGYFHFMPSYKGKRSHFKPHRLIAIHFIPNPNNYPQVNHKNGIKTDNRISNLEWCTSQHNIRHSVRTGLQKPKPGSSNAMAKLTELEVEAIYLSKGQKSSIELGKEFNVGRHVIESIFRGDSWNHVTGLKKRKRDENRNLIEDKNRYNYYTRKYVNTRNKAA